MEGKAEALAVLKTAIERNMQIQQAVAPLAPRLLDLHSTALYLGVSKWTVRDLEAGGVLPRVRVPLQEQGELRKILFDRVDLDRLIEAWKEEIQVGSEYGK